jgi:nucleotide-binding universal stress UspA family protein
MSTVGTTTAPVLVGVTGPGENTAALRYAVGEARSHRRPLLLVHAIHEAFPPPPPTMLVEPVPWQQVGNAVMAEVRDELEDLLENGALDVSTEVRSGPGGGVLVELSEHASVVVLQHRARSRLRRLFTGSTVIAAAADSRCPVVSVPAVWEPRTRTGRVVVGVHEDGMPEPVLAAAFAEAAAHGSSVHLVHAWEIEGAYTDLVSPPAEGWETTVRDAMDAAVRPFAEEHPSVTVELEVRRAWPAEALLDLADGADLLVVGRHGSWRHLPHRIGSIARTLVSEAPCPVMVVPV